MGAMAKRPKSICRQPGCSELTNGPGYCEKHADQAVGWNRSHGDKSSAERGYGAAWRRKRERVLQRDCSVCQPCLMEGKVHAATEVDHKINKAEARRRGWTEAQIDDESNLWAINVDCHKAKTARERRHPWGGSKV